MAETDLKIMEEELAEIHPTYLARGRKALIRRRKERERRKPKQSLELIYRGDPKNRNIVPIMNDALVEKMRTMTREQVNYLLMQSLAN